MDHTINSKGTTAFGKGQNPLKAPAGTSHSPGVSHSNPASEIVNGYDSTFRNRFRESASSRTEVAGMTDKPPAFSTPDGSRN